jgi:hypothetical protein
MQTYNSLYPFPPSGFFLVNFDMSHFTVTFIVDTHVKYSSLVPSSWNDANIVILHIVTPAPR